ncbi:MAG: hypothetical protein ABR962_05435 [Candidatus Bathyarchaeia archaeon]
MKHGYMQQIAGKSNLPIPLMKAVGAVQDAARVLRVMAFLHSAKDLPSILRLYGIENSSETA